MLIKEQNNSISILQNVHFTNVLQILAECKQAMEKKPQVTIDFTQAVASDSSGLALMSQLLKHAKARNKNISFIHVPAALQSAAKVCGVTKIFGYAANN